MIIQLERVVFDHTPNAATIDALSIRIDANHPAPDWIRGAPDTSRAAYALVPTRGNTLTIAAVFSFPGTLPLPPGTTNVTVRAQPVAAAAAALGSVEATPVPVSATGVTTGPIRFKLIQPELFTRGIGIYDVAWQWQVQLTVGGPWLEFDRSDHTIYVTLDLPGPPWTPAPGAIAPAVPPWTRALDLACVWAQGITVTTAKTTTALGKIGRAVEQGLYNLGGRATLPVTYNGVSDYAINSVFHVTDFLTLLEGATANGRGSQINCTDCASALVVFANLLGCRTTITHLHRTDNHMFRTNPVVPIGEDPQNSATQSFSYHEVAARGGAAAAGHVHDACLLIDRDTDPTTDTEADFKISGGLARGAFAVRKRKPFKYVHRLLAPDDQDQCESLDVGSPALDTQTALAPPPPPPPPFVDLKNVFRKQIDALSPPPVAGPGQAASLDPIAIGGFHPYQRALAPSHLALPEGIVTSSVEFFYVATPADGPEGDDRRLRISVGYCASASDAREALAWVLTQSAATPAPLTTAKAAHIEPVAFISPDKAAVFVVLGRAVARIRSVGRRPVDLTPILERVNRALDAR